MVVAVVVVVAAVVAGQGHVGGKRGVAARTGGLPGVGGPQVALVEVAMGKDLLAQLALVHGVLVVDLQVDVDAVQGDKEFATAEAHELGPARGVEGHEALLQL